MTCKCKCKQNEKNRKDLDKDLQIEEIPVPGYEKVFKVSNKKVNLQGYIALHNTVLGPALGGTRIYPYVKSEDALNDVLRLARGMTFKSAVAQVGFGGGKCVIIADPRKDKTPELLHSFAESVDSLKGKFITAEDVGSTTADIVEFNKKTKYVTGLPTEKGSGDPSRYTAWGVFRGIQSVAKKLFGSDSLEGKKIAMQGIGSVGLYLIDLLFWHGAEVVIADVNAERVKAVSRKYGVKAVDPKEILKEKCDILSPCALGGIINDESIPQLKCKAIAGCANNQLLKDQHGDLLMQNGILYAPDFVINSGGLINVSFEVDKDGYDPVKAKDKTHKIYDTLMDIYRISEKNKISTARAAVELAEYNIKNKIGARTEPVYFHN